ncbi:chemotaxis protein [Dechloromonas denitrificans]|uniref:Chemotaxis protein n=1 Tax=Dechloromonas denitrificans TaxID=281362 RepID=A0A133XP86_9RHOO|nr:response regulator [Dechloromonas denitrificans]KXB32752.1 chemotaxis protein [Dechloromonas denitrificans]
MNSKRTTIVIVDDNDMMRGILRGILRGEEYEVIGEARNGNIAVDMAERLKPDIICLDVMMPEKDGLEALVEIKAARPLTEIVMITGNADPDTVQESIMNGASGFIIKPFNAARVLDALAKVTARLRQKAA